MNIDKLNSINPQIINYGRRNATTKKEVAFGAANPVTYIPDSFIKNPWAKLKNFTIEEYKKLTEKEIELIKKDIKKAYFADIDADVKFHDIITSAIKTTLDGKFGEGNYVIIPLGRSISSIGKSLGYKIGEENVKQIPMSQAGRFSKGYLETCAEDFDGFMKYLESIGLSKKEIETSGKTYIITDYCCSGESLCGAERLLKSDKIWGNQPNVIARNITGLMDKSLFPFRDKLGLKSILYSMLPSRYSSESTLESLLAQSAYKCYSLVNKCDDLSKTAQAVIKPENYSKETKSFLFKLLDSQFGKAKVE